MLVISWNAGALLAFYFFSFIFYAFPLFVSLGAQIVRWYGPHSMYIFPTQSHFSRNTLTGILRDVCLLDDSNSSKIDSEEQPEQGHPINLRPKHIPVIQNIAPGLPNACCHLITHLVHLQEPPKS